MRVLEKPRDTKLQLTRQDLDRYASRWEAIKSQLRREDRHYDPVNVYRTNVNRESKWEGVYLAQRQQLVERGEFYHRM